MLVRGNQSNVSSGSGIKSGASKNSVFGKKKTILDVLFFVSSNSLRKISDWCTVMFVRWTEKEKVWEGIGETQQKVPGLFIWKLRTDTSSLSPLSVCIQLESPPVPRGRPAPWGRGQCDSSFLPGVWLWTDSRRHENNRWPQQKYKILWPSPVSDLLMFPTNTVFCSRQVSRRA